MGTETNKYEEIVSIIREQEALRTIKRSAMHKVFKWAAAKFQEKADELDAVMHAWQSAVNEVGGATNALLSLPVEKASYELIQAFNATSSIRKTDIPNPWLERRY